MKLRNKKTGKVIERNSIVTLRCKITSCSSSLVEAEAFSSIEKLNEEWEDYKPKEPLIKDEKIRKAVRAWAEANKEEELEVMGGCSVTAFKSLYNHTEIDFNCSWKLRDSVYTIEELCGEETE